MAIVLKDKTVSTILLSLAIISTMQAAYFTIQNRSVSNCLAQYSVATNDAIAIRQEIADKRQHAFETLIRDLLVQPENSDNGRQILEEYLDKQERLNKERSANPLPSVPTCN